MAQLYSAHLLDAATPVGGAPPIKKIRKRKNVGSDTEAAPLATPPVSLDGDLPKPKRVMSDAQRAALAKATEARKLKRAQALPIKENGPPKKSVTHTNDTAAAKDTETPSGDPVPPVADVKKKKTRKRKQPDDAADVVHTDQDASTTIPAPAPPLDSEPDWVKRIYKQPPTWFVKFSEGVLNEQAPQEGGKRKAKRRLKQEAVETAQQKWNDPQTRDRVLGLADQAMSGMFTQVFGNRRPFY